MLLDASKAFDRVEYVKLFNTLRDRKMCPIVLRLITNMYTNQEIQVKWNTVLSSKCKTGNGVKQGGCLSPSLFSVYLNNIIVKLRNSNIGCRCRSEYMGVFGYADDLSLLCPSFSGIKKCLMYVNVMPIRTKSYSMPAEAKHCTLVKMKIRRITGSHNYA